MEKSFIVAITGKQGSGKSCLANALAKELNADVYNLDIYAHKVLCLNDVKNLVKERFGERVFSDSGEINRKKLGEIVFASKEDLTFLNSLTYKYMQILLDRDLDSGKKIAILDYALLPKTKYWSMSNYKILMQADFEIRLSRLVKRDGASIEYLKKREKEAYNYNYIFDKVITSNKEIDFKQLAQDIKTEIEKHIIK